VEGKPRRVSRKRRNGRGKSILGTFSSYADLGIFGEKEGASSVLLLFKKGGKGSDRVGTSIRKEQTKPLKIQLSLIRGG